MALPTDPFGLVGTIVDGRYRIEEVAGQGGFGIVYRAFHLAFESSVALKVLRMPKNSDPAVAREQLSRFKREGRVLFELSSLHSSIVRAFETGIIASSEHTTLPYLALEWLDGVSLDQELRCRRQRSIAPMTLTEMLHLLDEAAAGMTLAHERGIAHRDIKPSNLFVTFQAGKPVVKILDFGIAKILDPSAGATTQFETTGATASSFTPMYAAPEQWLRRLGATGTWTDVHAWALVCLELLTGKPALIGDDSAQFMAAALDASVRPTPTAIGLDVSPEVEAVFARAVALDPRDRIASLGDFWTALRNAVQASSVQIGSESAYPTLHAIKNSEGLSPEREGGRTDEPSTTSLSRLTPATASRAPASGSRRLTASRRAIFATGTIGAVVLAVGVTAGLGNYRGGSSHSVAAMSGAVPEFLPQTVDLRASTASIPTASMTEDSTPSLADSPAHHDAGAVRSPHAPQKTNALPSPTAPSTESPSSAPAVVPRPLPPRTLDQLMQDEELVHRR